MFIRHNFFIKMVTVVFLVAFLTGLTGDMGKQVQSASPKGPSAAGIEQELTQLANENVLFSDVAKERFVNEVLDIYDNAADCDAVVYFCEGGWGSRPLAVNPEGRSLVAGIVSTLESTGYTCYVADYPRTSKTAGDYLYEGIQLLLLYPVKSKQLAAKVDFLTRHMDDMKIFIVGKSSGALYVNGAAKILKDNPDVFNIQIGSPLGSKVPVPGRSLAICDNGIQGDAMIGRNIFSVFKRNTWKVLFIMYAPSFTAVDWIVGKLLVAIGFCNTKYALVMPGHDYMWKYPKVGPAIETFLHETMGERYGG
jgi:hypothetical protein